jgi:mannose-1-phosphate guanylyltransferase
MFSLILCGGAGTRLWPLSRQSLPKQFYPLFDQGSLFEAVVRRNLPLSNQFAIAANRAQAFMAFEQLALYGIREQRGVIEPVGRNTAPAIALVALGLPADELILVCPSDHLIVMEEEYHAAVRRAVELASEGRIVAFGITPTSCETGYGYIEHDGENIIQFKEKPDVGTAERYVSSGRFLWNSGMYCFMAKTYLAELDKHAPDLLVACERVYLSHGKPALLEPEMAEMESIPSISIDYAIMEKSGKASVVPCDIGWTDLGSFDSLFPVAYDPGLGNSVLSEDAPLFIGSAKNLVIGRGKKKIVLIDVEDIAVIDTEDALLVMKHGSGQRVKEAVDILKRDNSSLLEAHTTVKKPWGSISALLDTERVKVSKISILPGKGLSLRSDESSQEHLVCVDGAGKISQNGEMVDLVYDKEVFIQTGSEYRLECDGDESLIGIATRIGDCAGRVGRPIPMANDGE